MRFYLRVKESMRKRKRVPGNRPVLPTNTLFLGGALGRRRRRGVRARHLVPGMSFFVETNGLRFKVTLTSARKWKTWRLDRRLYRVSFVEADDDVSQEDHLVLNMACNNALFDLVEEVLKDVQTRHLRAGRPREALLKLSLNADGLDMPVMSPMTQLFNPRNVPDFLDAVMNAFSSHHEISVEDGFELDFTVVDDVEQPNLVYAAGSGKTYSRKAMAKFPRPSRWEKFGMQGKRYVMLMPNFQGRYEDCCLLSALVFGLAYNRNQRRSNGDPTFQVMKRINNGFQRNAKDKQHRRRLQAAECLKEEINQVVERCQIDVAAFKVCSITGQRLKEEVEKLGINLVVYTDKKAFKSFMQIPREHDSTRETVHVLLMHTSENVYHASCILKPWTFYNKHLNLGTYCVYCKKEYSWRYGRFHKCAGLKKHQKCHKCRRVLLGDGMYLDRTVKKTICIDTPGHCEKCLYCSQELRSKDCSKAHHNLCFKAMTMCDGCGYFYKKEDEDKHVCDSIYCRYCRKRYKPDPLADGGHFCEMKRPSQQECYEKMAFFDTGKSRKNAEKTHVRAFFIFFRNGCGGAAADAPHQRHRALV